MNDIKVGAFDYVVLVAILLISILIGLYHGYKKTIQAKWSRYRQKASPDSSGVQMKEMNKESEEENGETKLADYLTASSSMGSVPLAFSLLATFFSSTTIIGTPAEVYQYGIQNWIITFGFGIVPPLMAAFVTGPFFARLKILSVFEYLEQRYQTKWVRLFSMTCYTIRNFISSAIFTLGPSTALSLLMNLDQNISIAIIVALATFYTCLGGIKAVIWSDLYQGVIMFASVIVIVIKGVSDAGGISNLWEVCDRGGRLNFFDFNPDPVIRQSFWSLVIGGTMNFGMYYCFDQQSIQRFTAAKTTRKAQIALLLNIPGVFLIMSLCAFCGLIAYANYYTCDPLFTNKIDTANQYFTYYVLNYFYMWPGVIGLFMGAVFCSALSSLSSYLNSLVAIIWKDVLLQFAYFRSFSDSKSLTTNKLIALLCGLVITALTYVVAASGNNLVQLSASLNSIFNGPLVGLFLMSILFSCSNKYGALVGFSVGLLATGWLSIGAFVVNPIYPKLNVSVESCFNESIYFNTSVTSYIISFESEETYNTLNGFSRFYAISYMYYSTFGCLNTLFFGLLTSIACGGLRNKVDKSLLVIDLSKWIKYTELK